MNHQPIIDPAFDSAAGRLTAIRWAASVGQPLSQSLATWCTPIPSAQDAWDWLNSDAWEEWSSGRDDALGLFVSQHHPRRYQDWNLIVRRAKEVLAPHENEMREGLAAVGLSASRALDIVKWDIVGALTCAAYQDCRIPADELRLLDIYEAGHVPVGFDTEQGLIAVF